MYDIDATSYISPNHSTRHKPLSGVVIHATAGGTRSSLEWLCDPRNRVSSHYVIDPSGQIYQLVADDQSAWHAGKSAWHDLTFEGSVNDATLGIELVNSNSGSDPYETEQINALTWLVEWKARQYAIKRENIVRHLDVAVPKGRKTDPAGFDWDTWLNGLTFGDEDRWNLWGTEFPIYDDQKHWAIPQTWLKIAEKLGTARSIEHYPSPSYSFRAFEHGVVLYRVDTKKTEVIFDFDIG